jgi:hypothetical protein
VFVSHGEKTPEERLGFEARIKGILGALGSFLKPTKSTRHLGFFTLSCLDSPA